jgi:hypothetical protein
VTLDEYMDPRRFPRTTRLGLTPRLQFLADAADLDRLYAWFAAGDTPTEELWLKWEELEEKAMARPSGRAQRHDRWAVGAGGRGGPVRIPFRSAVNRGREPRTTGSRTRPTR